MNDKACDVCGREANRSRVWTGYLWRHQACDVRQRTERETIARVVAWLRNQREERGLLRSVDALAHELESGEWKGGE